MTASTRPVGPHPRTAALPDAATPNHRWSRNRVWPSASSFPISPRLALKGIGMRRLCVFCGSSPGRNGAYVEAAKRLARAMAARGIGLVYGVGSVGVMGAVADVMTAAGGEVMGVIPEF